MLVHSVYFWLDKRLPETERKRFREGLGSLREIESLRGFYTGTPAATRRPVVDSTYDYALTVLFEDLQGHDDYQNHPLHKRFLDQFSKCWTKVVIYDHE